MPSGVCSSSNSAPLNKKTPCRKSDYTERNIYKLIRPTPSGLFLTDTKVGGDLTVTGDVNVTGKVNGTIFSSSSVIPYYFNFGGTLINTSDLSSNYLYQIGTLGGVCSFNLPSNPKHGDTIKLVWTNNSNNNNILIKTNNQTIIFNNYSHIFNQSDISNNKFELVPYNQFEQLPDTILITNITNNNSGIGSYLVFTYNTDTLAINNNQISKSWNSTGYIYPGGDNGGPTISIQFGNIPN